MSTVTGPLNLITDVDGLRVGNAHDVRVRSGVTVVLPDAPAIAAVDVRGGAPGTRETDLLSPTTVVERIDAVVLGGGSAFGLDAASAVMTALEPDQIVFTKEHHHCPQRRLTRKEMLLFWGLRIYLVFMIGVVVYQIWTGVR